MFTLLQTVSPKHLLSASVVSLFILLISCNKPQDFSAVNGDRTNGITALNSNSNLIAGGSADNTSALQSLLDNNPETIINTKGTYATQQLNVRSNSTITFQQGVKLVLDATVSNQAILYLPAGTHDVIITGGTLDANWQNNTNGSQLECIKMDEGCYNITVNGVMVNNAKDYGAIQIKGTTNNLCKNITLTNIKSRQTGRTAIECRGVEDMVITNPKLQHWGQQNPNSPAIQFQSVPSRNIQILSPVTQGYEGVQFAIESAAANVDNITISNGVFTDNTNGGNNGISGYFTNATFSYCTMNGGVGSQRSGYEIFGSDNTLDHPVVKRGIIAISTGSVTNANASNINILYPNVTSGGSNSSALDLGSNNGLILSNVTITGGKLDTRNANGNSSAFTFGYYGELGVVQNVTMNQTELYSSTSAVRIQAANGSKDLVLNGVKFMEQTEEVSDITHNVNYTINN